MTFKNSSAKLSAKKKTKKSFMSCSGCFGIFPVGTLIQAPPNQHKLRVVCKSCFKQYIGSNPPMPAVASAALKNQQAHTFP